MYAQDVCYCSSLSLMWYYIMKCYIMESQDVNTYLHLVLLAMLILLTQSIYVMIPYFWSGTPLTLGMFIKTLRKELMCTWCLNICLWFYEETGSTKKNKKEELPNTTIWHKATTTNKYYYGMGINGKNMRE